MASKNFNQAVTNAASKFFSTPEAVEQTNQTNYTYDINNTKHTNVKNKSKHYDERGKRAERFGLLLDKQLKEDLKDLTSASGSPSVNDLIITVLLEYVESPNNQELLTAFRALQKLKG